MKKTLLFLLAVVLIAACDKKTATTYVDGDYTAEYDTLDSHGWQAFVTITLVNDTITAADYDYLNADGDRKSLDSAYNARMWTLGGEITKPELYCPEIEQNIMDAVIVPSFDSIDVVTGATSSSEAASELVKAALNSAKTGDGDVSVTQPDPPAEK